MRAEVGDEQHGDDPTVHALCDRMAALMGKEAAVFLPSGTMCNVVAILTHCRGGDEVLAHETSHILHSEGGAHAAFTGVQILPLRGPRGMFGADDVRAVIRPRTWSRSSSETSRAARMFRSMSPTADNGCQR